MIATRATRVLVLQHIACEPPGTFGEVMCERDVEAVPVELDEGEPLPDWRSFDAILVMGGPMSVNDEREHPWLVEEKRAVGDAVRAGVPVLGVCLGSQLLASALGARVYPTPRPEIGLLGVELSQEGRRDPVLGALQGPLVTLQWHGDTFDLPDGAVALASSPLVPNQAFRYGERAYGVQFHLEATAAMAHEWNGVPAYRDALARELGADGARAFIADIVAHEPQLADRARRLFERWLALAA
jgi:GMP synthase (glutamine-hydrolysing)